MALRGVILDVDGTLVLSNDAHAHAWVEAFRDEGGRDVPYARVRPLIGMGGDKLIPTIAPDLSSDAGLGKRIAAAHDHLFLDRYAPHLHPAPGARELVERLHTVGLKTVVASSAKRDELAALLKAARVDDLLRETTSASDTKESKPDPDVVGAALKRIGLRADECRMIGDTPYDVEAGGRAGVPVIAVRCGGWTDAGLHGAIAIYDDPADLAAHLAESPLREALRHPPADDVPTMGTAAD
jgi:HAD superfamily hydrolase (TIGR01509 family)